MGCPCVGNTRHARQDLVSPSCSRIYTRAFRNHTQGDINMYSLDQQRKRRSNKKSPGFLHGVDKLWGTADLKLSREQHDQKGASDGVVENSTGGIDKEAFVNLMVKIHYLIICPPVRTGLWRVYFVIRANVRERFAARQLTNGSPFAAISPSIRQAKICLYGVRRSVVAGNI